jgi:hypothetical protein
VPAPEHPLRSRFSPPLLIVAVVVLAFLPSVSNGFTNWDDYMNLRDNPDYRGLGPAQLRWMWTTFLLGHYQPLSWMSLGLDFVLWGMNPWGYHLTSVLIHAANSVLLYYVILAVLRIGMPSPARWPAAAAALLHAVHPLRVESVAWVTERRDVLCGFFVLLALLAYLKRAELERQGRPATGWLALSCLAFAASLLSKALGIMLPVVLLILDGVPLGRWTAGSARRLILEKIPYFLLAAGDSVIMIRAMRSIEQVRPLASYSVAERAAQAAYGLCFYPLKTLWPVGLIPIYRIDEPLDPWQAKYVLPMLGVLAVTGALWARRQRLPAGLAAWGCYAALLLPVLGVVVTGFQVAADRYTYLAMMPASVLAAAGLEKLFRSDRVAPIPVSAALAGVLILLSLATSRQTEVWKDSITLWTHELRFDPDCSLAYNSRGAERQDRGDSKGAIEDCTKALSLDPSSADPYHNRGLARVHLGELDEAIRDFDAYLRLAPRSAKGYQNRGVARLQKRELAGALADLDEALKLAGPKAETLVARGRVRAAGGDLKGAAEDFDAALRIAPADWPLREETQGLRDIARRQAGGR